MSPPVRHLRWAVLRLTLLCACLAPHWALAKPRAVAPAPDPLQQAQACYGAGDLGCVLTVLAGALLAAEQQGERLRLLAFAAARLDRHAEARQHFAAWLQLPQKPRLDRALTPPTIYEDYSAALLALYSDRLELSPQLANDGEVMPAAPTATDLPRFAPPPRGDGGGIPPATYLVGLHGSLPAAAHWGPPGAHLGMELGIELDLPAAFRAGLLLGGWQRPLAVGAEWNPFALTRGGLGWRWGEHGLDVLLGLGVALTSGADAVVGALVPAMRYHWRPATRTAGFFVELASETLIGSQGPREVIGLAVGVLLRPTGH